MLSVHRTSIGSVGPELIIVEMRISAVSWVEGVSKHSTRTVKRVIVSVAPFGEFHFDVARTRSAHFLEPQRSVFRPNLRMVEKEEKKDMYMSGKEA